MDAASLIQGPAFGSGINATQYDRRAADNLVGRVHGSAFADLV